MNTAASKRTSGSLRLGLPKGRMFEGIKQLLADAGIRLRVGDRGYRPVLSVPGYEIKLLKPQNIIEMLGVGSRDLGFAGADWVAELEADVVDLLDTELDPVRMVLAAPASLLEDGRLPDRRLVIASEYETLTRAWVAQKGLDALVLRTYGATEVFPPEDADAIVDITQSGDTLRANGLVILDELMTSSTRLYAHPGVLEDPVRREAVDRLVLILRSVLEARNRVMLEVNVPPDLLERVVEVLPCMREPTVAPLHGQAGYAVKVACPRADLPRVIPEIKARGGSDIVVTALSQIVP